MEGVGTLYNVSETTNSPSNPARLTSRFAETCYSGSNIPACGGQRYLELEMSRARRSQGIYQSVGRCASIHERESTTRDASERPTNISAPKMDIANDSIIYG